MLYALLFLLQNKVKYLILYTVDEEKSTSTNNFISRPPAFLGGVVQRNGSTDEAFSAT